MKNNKKRKLKGTRTLSNNFYMIKLIWKICPRRVIVETLAACIEYFLWSYYTIIFVKYLFHAIETRQSFESIALFVLATTLVTLSMNFFLSWRGMRYRPLTNSIINAGINEILFDKATQVELACYEDTEFYNNYTLAMKDTESRASSVLESMPRILVSLISSIGVMTLMYTVDPYIILFVIFPLLGNFVFGKIANNLFFKRKKENIPHYRKMDYVNRTLYLQAFAKEIRLSNIFNVLKRTYTESFNDVNKVYKKYRWKSIFFDFLNGIASFMLIFEGVLFYSIYRALISHSMSLSEFVVVAGAMSTGALMLIRLSDFTIKTFDNGLYIENLRQFLDYEPKIKENDSGKSTEELECLEIKNISFTYKGQEKPTINEMSFKLNKGEKIALVGHNGAGKTTLVKLLMRLYDPVTGEIKLNGTDIKEYSLKEYRDLFAVTFQDYQMFSMSVAENVLMREPQNEEDRQRVITALQKSGVYERVEKMKNGIDTVLTREFDNSGEVLSGGEFQKIAIARAFAKDFEIAILDEPSSALDPIAEYKLFENMMDVCRDKTVIFISHRLSSVIHADRIYMLENGRIIEEGTHSELIKKAGKYADMFTKQANSYLETA